MIMPKLQNSPSATAVMGKPGIGGGEGSPMVMVIVRESEFPDGSKAVTLIK